jgi:signal transduction histidine kinase
VTRFGDEAAGRLARAAVELLGLDAAAVLDPEGSGGPRRARMGWPPGALQPATLSSGALAGGRLTEPVILAGDDPALAFLAGGAGAGMAAQGPEAVLLALVRDPSRRFSAAEGRALSALACAIDDLDRGVREARERTSRLVKAGMALARELSLDDLLGQLVETARDVLGARYAALGVLNDERTGLATFVTSGLTDEERARIGHLPRGRGILGVLIREARPLRLERIDDDPRSVGFPPNHPPMTSFLGVPVMLRGEAFGNLYMTEKIGGPFTAEDEAVAQTLAAQAAIAVDNARRYEAERRRAAEVESVQEVARAVLGTLDLDQLLPLIARRARSLTGADTVGVAFVEGGVLAFRFAHGTGALALECLRLPSGEGPLEERLREALGAEAVAVAPLEIAGEPAGALVAVGRIPFDEAARRVLAAFSSQAAIALGNARTVAAERAHLLASAELQAAQARERAAADGYRRAIEAQEAERARIARELHDEAGQVLTALALHLRALEDQVVEGPGRERLAELRRSVNGAAAGLRSLATELRPSGLREHGLASALERQAARLREGEGMEVDLAVDALPTDLPEETQIALYRVVQEALTNVARHARATRASVLATAHAGRLRLVIEDDGRGFDPATPTGRLGLVGIRERVELLGGQLRIESAPGAGTAVIVDLEVPNE